MGGLNLKKICPVCGGEMDHCASQCRTCYEKQRSESKMPYRGRNPLKLCPGCHQRWILNHSQFCWECYNRRRTKARKEKQAQQVDCIHHWVLDDMNHGVCIKCGAEKQFPTPKEQAYILARAFQVQKEPACLDDDLISEIVMV